MKKLLYIVILILPFVNKAQVGIGTDNVNQSAALELFSINKALLLPKVQLTGNTDVLTIPNPTTGLIVSNSVNNGVLTPTDNRVFKDMNYLYNGAQWQTVMTDDVGILTLNLPKVYARGRRTTSIACAGLTTNFNLEVTDNLLANGSITANRKGYYKFNVKFSIGYRPSTTQSPQLIYNDPNLNLTLTLKFRGTNTNVNNNYDVTYSGVVYLDKGQQSGPFMFAIGGGTSCASTGMINEEEVLWEYLGETNN